MINSDFIVKVALEAVYESIGKIHYSIVHRQAKKIYEVDDKQITYIVSYFKAVICAYAGIPNCAMEWDSRIRVCVKTAISCHSCECRNPAKVALEGDSCIRRNDILLEFSCFHTVSCAGMTIIPNSLRK
ncbi:MAG: hypothetical protein NT007_11860 [Candidatus Kapabacteria bacterium]|nr:hypothetical protein [Candidatus Kapabacteria bacterium]